MKKLIVVGGQGSGEIAMSVFEDMNRFKKEWDIVGYINDINEINTYFGKYKIVGNSDMIVDFVHKGYFIHYTYFYNAKKKEERVNQFMKLNIPLEAHASGIHPLAYINPTSKIGVGCLMAQFSSLSASAQLNNFIHMYANSFVGHDTEVKDYSTIAAGSVIGARNKLSTGVHFGLNSTTREDISVGRYSIIGAGSVVVKNIIDNQTVVGNPAKPIKV